MSSGVNPTGRERHLARGREGVTLVELMVVMAIIGILVLVGFNTMSSVIPKHRLGTAAEEMAGRLRAAKMLAAVHNQFITIVMDPATETYHACLDGNNDGDCADGTDKYLNLDSGREGTQAQSTWDIYDTIDIYDARPGSVTYRPPSGLPNPIMAGGALVNGVVCFKVEVGGEGDDYDARWAFRRVTVNPLVGTVTLWRNASGIAAVPACRNNPEDDAGWERL